MIHKSLFRAYCISCFVLFFPLAQVSRNVQAMPKCDPVYVQIDRVLITVLPTGTDDTINLRCAFDAALESGPGISVKLVAGVYHTQSIVVNGFQGHFEGVGSEQTWIENLPNVHAYTLDLFPSMSSFDSSKPVLITFVNGNFTISDLSIHVVGDEFFTPFSISGIDPIHGPTVEVVLTGEKIHTHIDHNLVAGEINQVSVYKDNTVQVFYDENSRGWVESPALVHYMQLFPDPLSDFVQDDFSITGCECGKPICFE